MRLCGKLGLAGLAVIASLAFAVSAASARRLAISNQRILAIWSLITFEVEGVGHVDCPLTLENSFHSRTISKVSGQLIGYVTEAIIAGGRRECNETGTAIINAETLPWHIRYDRFIGALPNITGIRFQVIGMSITLQIAGLPCTFRTEAAHPALFIWERIGTVASRLRADEVARIPPVPGFCFGEKRIKGIAEVFLQDEPGLHSTRIVVTLVA
jgi:hypothetical protein